MEITYNGKTVKAKGMPNQFVECLVTHKMLGQCDDDGLFESDDEQVIHWMKNNGMIQADKAKTKAELVAECEALGLDTKGSKAELEQRLSEVAVG
jgi:hypothetical protein